MRATWVLLAVLPVAAGCEAATTAAPVPQVITLDTGPLVEAIRELKPAPKAEWDTGTKPTEPTGAEKAVERLAEVFAEREKRALEREEAAAAKAAEPKPEPVQAVAHAAEPVGDYTGCVVCVGDPEGVLAGTSDCLPCNLVPKAIARANSRLPNPLPPGARPWTIGTTRDNHFWLRKCDDPATPVFVFYTSGKKTGAKVGFGGGDEETDGILLRHPSRRKEPAKASPEQRWTRQQAPPVQGAAYRSEWDPGPDVGPNDGGGSCAQPQQVGCGGGGQWEATWRWPPANKYYHTPPFYTFSRPVTYTCRNGVCRWE